MKHLFTYKAAFIAGALLLCLVIHDISFQINEQEILDVNNGIDTIIHKDSGTYSNLPHKEPNVDFNDITNDNSIPDSLYQNPSTINIRNTTLSLGESVENIISKFGTPNRINETEYDFTYYIYNNDYKKLLFVAVLNGYCVGYYTDSLDFNFIGISSGSDLDTINEFLDENYILNKLLTYETNDYTLRILIDEIGTEKVIGVYILSNKIKLNTYTNACTQGNELIVFDLINSIRARNGEMVLSWCSSASICARKHSLNMADNDFFDHVNPSGRDPVDRMKSEGISCQSSGENIIAGYGGAIISNHALYNSEGHRKNLLSNKFRYVGVGCYYDSESIYGTYITQDFYR